MSITVWHARHDRMDDDSVGFDLAVLAMDDTADADAALAAVEELAVEFRLVVRDPESQTAYPPGDRPGGIGAPVG